MDQLWSLSVGAHGGASSPTAGQPRTIMFVRIADAGSAAGMEAKLPALGEMLGGLTPLVEPAGPEGFYLDLSGCERMLGPAAEVARELAATIPERLGLRVAVGIGPNKLIAGLAARKAGPGRCLAVPAGEAERFMAPLPLAVLPGLRGLHREQLSELGLETAGQLAGTPAWMLRVLLGESAAELHRLARGADLRAVRPPDPELTTYVSRETHFAPTLDLALLERLLWIEAATLCRVLRRLGKAAGLVSVTLEFGAGAAATRQKRLPYPVDAEQLLVEYGRPVLLAAMSARRRRVRGMKLTLTRLTAPATQLGLAPTRDEKLALRYRRLNKSLEAIWERYGQDAVQLGKHWAAAHAQRIVSWSAPSHWKGLARPGQQVRIIG